MRLIMILATIFIGSTAVADWSLENDSSDLYFVTTKALDIAEVHQFTDLAGRIGDDGIAAVSIALDSVDTGIAIRDERLREMLFETQAYPESMIRAEIDMNIVEELLPGSSASVDITFTLDLHGVEIELNAPIIFSRMSDNVLTVTNAKPILVSASSLNLSDGVEALRKIANLPSIGSAVPVTFVLTFVRF